MKNLPLNAIENSMHRRFCKHDELIGIKNFRETIFQLKAGVEEDISADLIAAKFGGTSLIEV